MIPILYDSTEVSFTSNGLGRLADCISCTVTEERNGIYECQFQYPITGEMYPLIQEGCILGVIHDDVKDIQPFDIYGRSAPLNGVVTFFAHHISYRLGNIILKPMSAPTCASALNEIPNNTYTECPFTFWTDKSVSTAWKNEVPNPVKAILGGQQGSILDVYGKGEYEFDKWLVRLYVNRGVDNGVAIRYGVNLTDLRHDIDTSGAYTGVVPFWKSAEDDTVVTLAEGYVMVSVPQLVPLTENNGEEITDDQGRTIYLNAESSSTLLRTSVMDLSEAFEEQPTQEQLRAEALRRLTNCEAWPPSENIKVSFVDLAHTEEYKAVSALQRVRLCDWVSVYCGPLGVSAVSMQVIRVVFNVLNERYNEIELGKARTSFADTVLQDVTETVSDTVEHVKSLTASAIDKVTKQITGANGGHIRFVYDANGIPQEILIMDIQSYNWNGNDGEDYTSIISKLKLNEASEPTYGFGRGFVPTIQYYENGQVKDAAVTFNDSLIKNGDNYKVDSTYYTEERLTNLNFLKDSNVETKVLKGLDVPNEDTDSKYHFWSHEAAFKYHSPILEQFLKTYCL